MQLFQSFRSHLSKQQINEEHCLDATVEFLEVTSTMVKNFTSGQPYTSIAYSRFDENEKCLGWLRKWRTQVSERNDLVSVERNKLFISTKTMFDISSTMIGFRELCKITFKKHPGCSIAVNRTNSNIVENVFCQQRGLNGQNDNPNYVQYGSTMNSILLGQASLTKKSNTGSVDSLSFYKPSKLPVCR